MNSDGPYTADEKFVIKAFGSLDKITQQMFLAWATLVRIEGDAKRAQNWLSEAMNMKICGESTHNIPSEKPAESETLSEAEIALLAGTATDEWKTQKWTTYENVDAVDVTESKKKRARLHIRCRVWRLHQDRLHSITKKQTCNSCGYSEKLRYIQNWTCASFTAAQGLY